MPAPKAYFLTWATYASRLHGDARGTVDRDHNHYGTPYLSADAIKQDKRLNDTAQEAYYIDPAARGCLEEAFKKHVQVRNWYLHALNIRTNHVHLVVTAQTESSKVLNEFKAYGTRALRTAGLIGTDRKVWARGGSKRLVWDQQQLTRAVWTRRMLRARTCLLNGGRQIRAVLEA